MRIREEARKSMTYVIKYPIKKVVGNVTEISEEREELEDKE